MFIGRPYKGPLKDTPDMAHLYLIVIHSLLKLLSCASVESGAGKAYTKSPQSRQALDSYSDHRKESEKTGVDRQGTLLSSVQTVLCSSIVYNYFFLLYCVYEIYSKFVVL